MCVYVVWTVHGECSMDICSVVCMCAMYVCGIYSVDKYMYGVVACIYVHICIWNVCILYLCVWHVACVWCIYIMCVCVMYSVCHVYMYDMCMCVYVWYLCVCYMCVVY